MSLRLYPTVVVEPLGDLVGIRDVPRRPERQYLLTQYKSSDRRTLVTSLHGQFPESQYPSPPSGLSGDTETHISLFRFHLQEY